MNGEWQRECNYCGLCSMSYMYLQNKQAGLYFGSHDCRFPVTGLMVRTGEESRYLSLGFRIHKMIRPGEAWESGAFTVCLSDQDGMRGRSPLPGVDHPSSGSMRTPNIRRNRPR